MLKTTPLGNFICPLLQIVKIVLLFYWMWQGKPYPWYAYETCWCHQSRDVGGIWFRPWGEYKNPAGCGAV